MKFRILPGVIIFMLSLCQPASAQTDNEINGKLSKITLLSINNTSMELPEDSVLRKYLKIELISKDSFWVKQKTAVNYLLSDTAKFRKKNGVTRIPVTGGTMILKDRDTDDDGMEVFDYLGQYPFLKAFLVRVQYWEHFEYKLWSKSHGTTMCLFPSMPLISPDKKKIVTISSDVYENDAGIEIFSIPDKFKTTLSVRFHNWMPGADDGIFWASDGKIYLPVLFNDKSIQEGDRTAQDLFIRISLL